MTIMQTKTGRRFDLTNPASTPIDVLDVAWSLSMLARFNGHATRFYSVAEHSCRMARFADQFFGGDRELQLACLLHDAHEAFLGDVSSPVKNAIGDVWAKFESPIVLIVREQLGAPEPGSPAWDAVKRLDRIMLWNEREQLMAESDGVDWDFSGEDRVQLPRFALTEYKPAFWTDRFLELYEELRS